MSSGCSLMRWIICYFFLFPAFQYVCDVMIHQMANVKCYVTLPCRLHVLKNRYMQTNFHVKMVEIYVKNHQTGALRGERR